jgi:signal transduction histidine kinase
MNPPTPSPQAETPSHRILTVAEDELSRIILDIHDGPVQYLFTALSLLTGIQQEVTQNAEQGIAQADLAPRLAQLGMLLESSLYEIKFFLGTFRPPEFRRRSLTSMIEGLVIQHEEWTNNSVELSVAQLPEEVPLAVKIALYRIVQEALSNSYRHAGVEKQWVRLWHENHKICLEVQDEGLGFVPPDLSQSPPTEREEHIGLRGMRDRVALLGGLFHLTSQPGVGTCVHVEVPIEA